MIDQLSNARESSATPGVQSESLTNAMLRDLEKCVGVYERTVGTLDYPGGADVRLRTGRALERKGLVRVGNAGSANRSVRWIPTQKGHLLVTYMRNLARP